jgi:hypothetical protein
MQLHKTERGILLEAGNELLLKWPVSAKYRMTGGRIVPTTTEFQITSPLSKPELYLSFSRLGFRGQPSEESVLSWVCRHGLLRREGEAKLEEPPERWGDPPTEDEIAQRPTALEEFREEVRTFRQLLALWTDVRARDGAAVLESFVDPPTLWPDTPLSWVDRFYDRYRAAFGKKYRQVIEESGQDTHSLHLKLGLDIVLRTINAKLGPSSQLLLGWNWWDAPHPASTSVALVQWYGVPDLLSAMYLQLNSLVTHNLLMRRCESPTCRQPFPVTRRNKRFCNDTCRSNARHSRNRVVPPPE